MARQGIFAHNLRAGALALLAVAASAAAAEAPANPHLERARAQLDAADYEGALGALGEALRWPDNDDDAIVEILRRTGEVNLFLERADRAEEAFRRLLVARPDYQMPDDAHPRAGEAFDLAKERFAAAGAAFTMRHAPVGAATAGEPVGVEATIENLPAGFGVQLFHRRGGDSLFSSAPLRRGEGGAWRAVIPALAPGEGDLEYYLEVRDASGVRMRGAGSAASPLVVAVTVPPPPPPPWWTSPWLWGGALVAVAIAGGSVILLLPRGDEVLVRVKLP